MKKKLVDDLSGKSEFPPTFLYLESSKKNRQKIKILKEDNNVYKGSMYFLKTYRPISRIIDFNESYEI